MLKILMLEDITSDAAIIKHELKKNNMEFVDEIVDNKDDFIDKIKNFKPDIILSDYSLPQFDGMQALQIRQEIAPLIPFILVTGSTNEEVAVECMKKGADDYVLKQNLHRISEAVKSAIRKKEIVIIQKETEIALQKSEEKYRTVADNATDWIFWQNPQNNFVYISPACKQISGYEPEEFQINSALFYDIIHPDDKKIWDEHLKLNERNLVNSHVEFRIIDKHGNTKWIEHRCSTIFDKSGKNIGTRGSNRDVTQRVNAVQSLRESEQLIRLTIDSLSANIAILDENGYIIQVNKKWRIFAQENNGVDHQVNEGINYLDVCDCAAGLNSEEASIVAPKIRSILNGELSEFALEYPCNSKKENRWFLMNVTSFISGGLKRVVISHENITARKQAEIELKESHEQFESIFKLSPEAIVISEIDTGIYLDVNQTFCSLSGYQKNEVVGSSAHKLNFVIEDEETKRWSRELANTNVIENAEYKFRKKDGTVFSALVSTKYIDFAGKQVSLSIIKDISERKNAEYALKEKNTFIQTVLDNLPIGVALNKINEGTAFYWNKKFMEIYGWPSEELKDLTNFFLKVYPDEKYRNLLIGRIMSDIQSGDPTRMHWEDCRVTHQNGEIHFVNAVNIPLYDQNTMVSTVTDFTDIKKAELALRESEEKFRLLFENSMDGIIYSEPNGKVLLANKAACEMFGMTEDEIIKAGREGVLDPGDKRITAALEQRIRTGYFQGELNFRKKNGQIFPVEVSSSIFVAKDGIAHTTIIFRDITERKKYEIELQESRSRLETIFKLSPDAIALNDLEDERYIDVNEKFVALSGYDKKEIIGRTSIDLNFFIDINDRSKWYEIIKQDGHLENMELKFRLKNGSSIDALVSSKTITLNRKLINLSIIKDISDRKIAENKMGASEKKYRQLFETLSEGVTLNEFIFNKNGKVVDYRILEANPAFYHTAVYVPGKVIGNVASKLYKLAHSEIESFYNTHIKARETVFYEFVSKISPKTFFVSISPIVDNKFVTSFLDITDMKEAEKNIAENEKRYRDIFDLSPNAVLIHQDGNIVMANPSALKLLKAKSFEQLSKKKAIDLVHPDYKNLAIQRIKKMMSTSKSVEVIHEKMVCLDGSVIDTEISAGPITFNGRTAIQVVGRDVTDKKNMEDMILLQRDLSSSLITVSSFEQAIKVIFEYAHKIDGIDNGAIHIINEGNLELFDSFGLSKSFENLLKTFQPKQAKIKIKKTGVPRYFLAKEFFGKNVKNSKKQNVKAFATIPIKEEKKVFGIIVFASATLNEFSKGQKNLLETIAYQAGSFLARIIAENALRESEEKYRRFFETDLTADFRTSISGSVLDCNPAYITMFEFPSKEIALRYPITKLYSEKTTGTKILTKLKSEKKLELIENTFLTYKGNKIIVVENIFGEFDSQNKLIGTVGYLFDITKIRIAENALKESEKRYRYLFQSMQNGFALHEIILDRKRKPVDYRFLAVNPAFEKMTGLIAKKAIGKTVKELIPNIENSWLDRYGKVALTGNPVKFENYTQPMGKYFRVLAYSPEKLKFAVLIEDITEARKAEAKIRQLSTAVEQSSVIVVITDYEGNIEYVNERFTEITGYSKEEAVGQNPRILKSGLNKNSLYKDLWKTIKSGKDWSGIFYNRKKNGELFWESDKISPVRNNDGKITHFVAIKEDITEKVKVESELEMHRNNLENLVEKRTKELDNTNQKLTEEIEKEKKYEIMLKQSLEKEKELSELKSKFISTTSHEFRTPLTSVLSSTELIQRYGKKWSEEKFSYHLAKIKNSIEYLTNLLDDVLTISRSESGKIAFNPVLTDLHKICNEIIEEVRGYAKKEHKFKFSFRPSRKKYILDPKLVRFILVNLLSNAFKYSPLGGKVELEITVQNGSIQMNIMDQGIGIPEEDIKFLFEPFHRGGNTMEITGTGLGLSIVKRAVDMHLGSIKIDSKLNEGTSIWISLPIK